MDFELTKTKQNLEAAARIGGNSYVDVETVIALINELETKLNSSIIKLDTISEFTEGKGTTVPTLNSSHIKNEWELVTNTAAMYQLQVSPSLTTEPDAGLYLQSSDMLQTIHVGATYSFPINIINNLSLLILATQILVEEDIVLAGGGTTWKAEYVDTEGDFTPVLIADAQPLIKNTQPNTFNHFLADIHNRDINIVITPNSGTLVSGKIRAVVYYYLLSPLSNI